MAIRARENEVGVFAANNINPYIVWILMGLGIVVGYFVAEKDVQTFLFASVSLVIVSYFGISGFVLNAALTGANVGKVVSSVLGTLLILFVPATIIVALKTVFSISRISAR
jgi:hypothetical protein